MANTVLQKSVIVLDIMLNGSFVCQMKMPYCPLFPLDEREVYRFVTEKKPSLSNKPFKAIPSNAAPLFRGDANIGG